MVFSARISLGNGRVPKTPRKGGAILACEMSVRLHDSKKKLSATLLDVSGLLPPGTITLRLLLELIGEQGMLLVCVLLTVPFLIPVSIPGVSTVFGLAIIQMSVAITVNRVPWLPRPILDRPVATSPLKQAFDKGSRFVALFERVVRPRGLLLTRARVINAVHGLALVVAGILLMMPFGLVPFSNTLPALAILLLSLGMLERDGLFIVAGYVMNIVTVIYFAIVVTGATIAGEGILGFIRR